MKVQIEDYEEFILPLNLFENEKEVQDFCKISDNIEDLQAFKTTCFECGGCGFVHLINERIEELRVINN